MIDRMSNPSPSPDIQSGTAQSGRSFFRRYGKRALVIMIVLLVAGLIFGVLYGLRNLVGLKPYTIENGGAKYDVLFYLTAKPVKTKSGNALQDGNDAFLTAKPSASDGITDCSQIGKGWKEAFKINWQGEQQSVCTVADMNYTAYLPFEGRQHLVSLTYEEVSADGEIEVARQIFESVRISQ